MGLDMYLTARLNTYKPYGKEKESKIRKYIKKNLKGYFASGNIESITIEFEAGYWRKANAIHKWFVENTQDGQDNCQSSYVSREDLEKLKKVCEEVLDYYKDKKLSKKIKVKTGWSGDKETFEDVYVLGDEDKKVIENLLPTTEGFFFGSVEYDEWYFEDVKKTIEIINKCLKLPEEFGFEYSASW